MACVVISHADVAAQVFMEAQMVESIFSCKIRRAEVEISIGNKDFKMVVVRHGLAQSLCNVDIAILKFRERPIARYFFAQDLIRNVGFEFEFSADVIIERGGVRAKHIRQQGIILNSSSHAAAVNASEARSE